MSKISNLFERHKAVRRIALLWAMCLITYATHQMFSDISQITGPSVAAYGSVTALLAAVIGLYQWLRGQDDKKDCEK